MTNCGHLTENDTGLVCLKHRVHYCRTCARCKDPSIYCKFRLSCIIHFLDKERSRPSAQRVN